jgi:hypothetical protein
VAFLRIGFALGGFEGEQDFVADAGRVFDGLESGRDRFPGTVTEVVIASTRGDDQRVIRKSALCQDQAVAFGVDVDGFAQQHTSVLLLTEQKRKGTAISPGESAPVAT